MALALVGKAVGELAEIILQERLLDRILQQRIRAGRDRVLQLTGLARGLHAVEFARPLPVVGLAAGRSALGLPQMVGALADAVIAFVVFFKWVAGHRHVSCHIASSSDPSRRFRRPLRMPPAMHDPRRRRRSRDFSRPPRIAM
nr:hypothetical protein [uncultured Lichenicoccus sp.]